MTTTAIRLLLLTIMMAVAVKAPAQEAADEASRSEAASLISQIHAPWENVSISGKAKVKGMPVSVSVKIYMERDSLAVISLRAPFIGEAVRIEADLDSVTAVNKMKKVYCRESLEKAFEMLPDGLSDLQNIILGRPVVPGLGVLDASTAADTDFYPDADGCWLVVPFDIHQPPGWNYGMIVGPEGHLLSIIAESQTSPSQATAEYEYDGDRIHIDLDIARKKKTLRATLDLDAPEWGGKPLDRIRPDGKYQRVDFAAFIKSF